MVYGSRILQGPFIQGKHWSTSELDRVDWDQFDEIFDTLGQYDTDRDGSLWHIISHFDSVGPSWQDYTLADLLDPVKLTQGLYFWDCQNTLDQPDDYWTFFAHFPDSAIDIYFRAQRTPICRPFKDAYPHDDVVDLPYFGDIYIGGRFQADFGMRILRKEEMRIASFQEQLLFTKGATTLSPDQINEYREIYACS